MENSIIKRVEQHGVALGSLHALVVANYFEEDSEQTLNTDFKKLMC
jgi:hypothetical protein